MILDVGENEFVGNIPTWFGERFSRVVVLILRSNQFHGLLPNTKFENEAEPGSTHMEIPIGIYLSTKEDIHTSEVM